MPRTRAGVLVQNQDTTLNKSEVEPTRTSRRRNAKTILNNLESNLNISGQDVVLNLNELKRVVTRSRAHDLDVSKNVSIQVPKKKKAKKNSKSVKKVDHEENETSKIINHNKNLNNVLQNNDSSFSSDKENIEFNKPNTRRRKKKIVKDKDNGDQKEPIDDENLMKKPNKKSRRKKVVEDESKISVEVENHVKSSAEVAEHNSSKETTFHSLENDKSLNELNDTLPEAQIIKPKKIASFSLINDSILDKASSTMIETHIENEKRKGLRMPLRNIRISGIEELVQNDTFDTSALKQESTYVKEDDVPVMKRENTYVKEEVEVPTLVRENTYVKEEETLKQNKTVDITNNTTRNVFQPASPCSIFKKKDNSTINVSAVTPPRILCSSVSFGSAGCTPIPRKSKLSDKSAAVDDRPDGTPKSKARPLNITHSMEKPENNHYVKSTNVKSVNRVAFASPKVAPRQNISILKTKNGMKKAESRTNLEDFKNKKRVGISKLPKPTKPHISEAKSKQIAKMIQSSFRATPSKDSVVKIVQPMSRTKMPNFASLHKKQFDQMESLVQNKARKEERAKQLFSATTPNYMKNLKKDAPSPKVTQFGFKPRTNNYNKLPPIVFNDYRSLSNSASKAQCKDIVARERSTVDVVRKTREASKDFVAGVRTNRRFELQMKARNMSAT